MSDRCILVTGTSRGIGASVAVSLAQAGYVVGCMTRAGALPPHASLAPADAARLIPLTGDVTRLDALQAGFGALADRGLKIVGAVNNAGIHSEGASAELAREEYERIMTTNATSVLLGCQAAYPHLVANGGGLIVNIGSFFDKMGVKRQLAYCASKAAVGAITRCLAVEWAGKGIRVLDVAPGYIQTDFNKEALAQGPLRVFLERRIPGKVPGTTEDVARLVTGLFTIDSPYFTGETIYLDGGQAIAH